MDTATKLTAALAAGRLAIGAGLLAAPGPLAATWLGDDARRPTAKVANREFGARDVALAVGVLTTLDDGSQLRRWVAACAACDLADAVTALTAPSGGMTPAGRWGTVAVGGGAALAGALLLRALED